MPWRECPDAVFSDRERSRAGEAFWPFSFARTGLFDFSAHAALTASQERKYMKFIATAKDHPLNRLGGGPPPAPKLKTKAKSRKRPTRKVRNGK